MRRPLRIALWVLGILIVLGAVAIFVMFGPPNVAESLAEPEFCASCHVMKPQLEAFEQSPHRNLETCNDCHLPNNSFVRHWFWDGVVGVRDLVEFNLNMIPEHIVARERSKDWIQENCYRCHENTVENVHPAVDSGWCWDCHREVYHDIQLMPDRESRRPTSWQEGE